MLSIHTKDIVYDASGRLGRVVGYIYRRDDPLVYHILWFDTDTIEDMVEGSVYKYVPMVTTIEGYQ
jgi:hypothetical protein